MKKFVNDIDAMQQESLHGLVAAHAQLLELAQQPSYVMRRQRRAGKVALISGGGAGHEPLHSGCVGPGMLDAACPGAVFTAPTPDQMLAAARAVDGGRGVLFIVKNYLGDSLNFRIASELLELDNATVLVNDDVALDNTLHGSGRRGVAGTLIVEKMVGAAAEQGADLAACKALGDLVNRSTATMGVALTSCTPPDARRPTFELAADEIEMGVGIHGEPGRRRIKQRSAQMLVADMLAAILADLQPAPGASVLLHVNGFGATPLMELYLLYHNARQRLERLGYTVRRSLVGNYTTALEMAGASLTVSVLDDYLTALWDAPVHTAALRW